MSIATITRRSFLKGACILTGGLFIGLHTASKAYSKIVEFKHYMLVRIDSVYGADSAFPHRASQDNEQVIQMYKDRYEKPLSHLSEHDLHTKWYDRSAGLKALEAEGQLNPRAKEFAALKYPYEAE